MATIADAVAFAAQEKAAGRPETAEAIYRKILQEHPRCADVWLLLAMHVFERGARDEAIAYFARAAEVNPSDPILLENLGKALTRTGRALEAAEVFLKMIRLVPENPEAYYQHGLVLVDAQQWEAAEASLREALRLKPEHPAAAANLGVVRKNRGDTQEAIQWFEYAERLNPHDWTVLNNLGVTAKSQNRFEEALAYYRRAIELNPRFAPAVSNLANLLNHLARFEEAEIMIARALELAPNFAEAHFNLGALRHAQARFPESIAAYDQALRLKPKFLNVRFDRSCTRLLNGDLSAFADYELRREVHDMRFDAPFPEWQGEDLREKTILLIAEQGLGDAVQFVRYAAILRRAGAEVGLRVRKPLVPMFQSSGLADLVLHEDELVPVCDYWAPLMSIPYRLGRAFTPAAETVPYLHAEPERIAKWSERMRDLPGIRIGLAWQGNPKFPRDHLRSIPLAEFRCLCDVPGISLVSLQKNDGLDQVSAWQGSVPITRYDDADQDAPFLDTLAIMRNLDLVISSDTSIVHVAGALGVPTWLALPFVPDWRWFLNREDSPWYPTMRLFRQRRWQDWTEVLQRIALALRQFAARHAASKRS